MIVKLRKRQQTHFGYTADCSRGETFGTGEEGKSRIVAELHNVVLEGLVPRLEIRKREGALHRPVLSGSPTEDH
jgi:hypothetical protein